MNERPRPFVRMVVACLFFFVAVAMNILLPRYWHNIPEIVKHLLLVFSAIMCVHIMEYAYLWWEIFGHIRNILKETLQATHQLIDDNRDSLEKSLQHTNRLIGSAALCGLTNIYCSRKDVKGDIYDAIENAEKRVWLLGVTFSENVHLDELLSTLNEKITRGLDIRILLLDVFQETAVFRAIFESTAHEIEKIINTDRTKTLSTDDPIFHLRLYSDFTHTFDRLQNYPDIKPAVRFYTQNPTGWLMIIDNMAYFQPYTFGRSASQRSSNLCVGAHMPVFKYQMQQSGKPFEILEDHFLKLWLTSCVDLFHMESQIADRNRIIKETIDSHASRLKYVFDALHTSKCRTPYSNDRRKFPRQTWEWKQPSLKICLQDRKTTINASMCDYSREGVSLKVETTDLLQNHGQIVTLQGESPFEPRLAGFTIDHFLEKNQFVIRRITKGSQPIIGLQIAPEEDGQNGSNQIDRMIISSPS
ncbi:MAG: hypothetical protein AYP45_02100 [Candidatus Brocadia carolinensis]|uniref:PilZ domain-containing protein n=1 Tax=Candidatus Brocadia carolinensis TaxID=1004156 RepID=A0A1V4AX11_9BACT|nr:MAG: hypothetical protein AYP45_02100 [Candidatus Brocadia caroliniensis]